jgi:hypothetical protein
MQISYCNTQPFNLHTALTSAATVVALEQPPLAIPGYPGYTVTDDGRVYRAGKLLQPVKADGRCSRIRISINGKTSKIAVARLVALAHVPNPNNYSQYIHKDHALNNCHASNLQWVSDTEYRHFKANKRLAKNAERQYDYEELLGPVKRKKEKPVIDLGGVPVNDFPGYFITREGVVYKKDRILANLKGNRGCLRVKLRYPTEKKEYLRAGLATLVAEHFVPNPKKYKHVIFIDRNKLNCHASNLAWVDGQTFMYWSGAARYQDGKYKKKVFTKEEALQRCNHPWLKRYYESGNETFLMELWKEIDHSFTSRNFKLWPQFRSECYMYLKDRLDRYSLFHNPIPIMVLYTKHLEKKLREEISIPLPKKRLRQTDESLRSRNYAVGDISGKWMWEGIE